MRLWAALMVLVCGNAHANDGATDGDHMFLWGTLDPAQCLTTPAPAPMMQALRPMTSEVESGLASHLRTLKKRRKAAVAGPTTVFTAAAVPLLHDPQLAVNDDYILAMEAHSYAFYDRHTLQPLVASNCIPVSGSFFTLFAPLLTDKIVDRAHPGGIDNPNDLNKHLFLKPTDPEGCDPANPFALPQQPTQCDPAHPTTPPPPGSYRGCMVEAYDARPHYDYTHQRWWIVAQTRAPGTADPDCDPGSRRYLLVAVSRDRDPRQGWYVYALVRDYADWPLFAVNGGHLVLGHLGTHDGHRRVYLFDADLLVSGDQTHKDPFLHRWTESDIPEAVNGFTPVTQHSDAEGHTLFLGYSGSTMTLFAFSDPGKPLLRASTTTCVAADSTCPNVTNSGSGPAVYRHNRLYLPGDTCSSDGGCSLTTAVLMRVPVTITRQGTAFTLALSNKAGDGFALDGEDAAVSAGDQLFHRIAAVEVNANDVAVMVFLRYGTAGGATVKPDVRYAAMFPTESQLRKGTLVMASQSIPANYVASLLPLDLPGAALDSDGQTVWVAHGYFDSAGTLKEVIAASKPGCGDQTACGAACVDLSSDDANCGRCGNGCGAGFGCKSSKCVCVLDTKSDNQNCGSCGNVCKTGYKCTSGQCLCHLDTRSDPKNCGTCGHACSVAQSCVDGHCCSECICEDGFHGGCVPNLGTCQEHICRGHERH